METKNEEACLKIRSTRATIAAGTRLYLSNFRRIFRITWLPALLCAIVSALYYQTMISATVKLQSALTQIVHGPTGQGNTMQGLTDYLLQSGVSLLNLIVSILLMAYIFYLLLIAGFIAAISSPIVKLLDKIHFGRFQMPRWVSAMITTILIWGVLVLFVVLTIPFVGSQVAQFQNIDIESLQAGLSQPIQKIDEFVRSYPVFGMPEFSTEEVVIDNVKDVINFSALGNIAGNLGSTAIALFLSLFSITFFTYFFLKETKLFRSLIMALVPTRYEEKATHILDKLPKLIKNYLHGIFFEMLAVTTLITIGMLICGQNFGLSLLIGMLCGFLNIIPYLGPWIGAGIGIAFIGAANVNLDFYTYTMPQIYGLLITVVVVRLIDDFVFQPFFY